MGNSQTTASWSVDDWAYGTGTNAVPVDEVVEEVGKLPARYFGGKAIENDASMHQMQQDLLTFDETLKKIFRRKKNKRSKQEPVAAAEEEGYYYEDDPGMLDENVRDLQGEPVYLESTTVDRNTASSTPNQSNNSSLDAPATRGKLIWRCTHCAMDNKVTESSCRRCGQAETKF
ncbi:unnamed protein product [Adineta ricciae]|uniref:RanBP2-type domain-containing protein n=1 Tax=Adineta ricciae TaxID=249248 RepID=A0A816AS84_ADIRI|nr:unnamed protein product [Adineta ricciae]CAF1599200.1 unnamed protein product [Adineta ricciae]